MTIASEITRLQGAKADIKTSIETKGVVVPSSTKLDGYSSLIDQIQTGSGLDLFVPATITIENAIRNTNESARVTEDIADVVVPDGDAYYHYFWFRDSSTTAYSGWRVGCFKKTKGANPTLTYSSVFEENNYYYNYVKRNDNYRIKFDGNDVKMSTLAFREYDSNGLQSHGGKVTITLYCINATNGVFSSINTLGSVANLDDKYSYNYTDIPNWDELWTASCGITAQESIASVGYTTLNFTSGSGSYYNLVATMTV